MGYHDVRIETLPYGAEPTVPNPAVELPGKTDLALSHQSDIDLKLVQKLLESLSGASVGHSYTHLWRTFHHIGSPPHIQLLRGPTGHVMHNVQGCTYLPG